MAALSLFLDVPLMREADRLLDAYQEDPSPDKVYLDHWGRSCWLLATHSGLQSFPHRAQNVI